MPKGWLGDEAADEPGEPEAPVDPLLRKPANAFWVAGGLVLAGECWRFPVNAFIVEPKFDRDGGGNEALCGCDCGLPAPNCFPCRGDNDRGKPE